MPREYAPPPLLTIVDGATSVNLQQLNTNDDASESSSSSSSSSSIIIVIIVISSAIIVSASLYLLLRFISRRCHRSLRTFSAADDVVSDQCFQGRRVSPDDLISSLPLFTFSSVAGNIAGGDCAVCLSNFEHHDQLRLLPLCCHAFHARCIDTWLVSNQTCPLCRSTVYPTESEVQDKIHSAADERGNSFRIEIGNISRRREPPESGAGRRSYSIGSFEYIVDDSGYEVSVQSTHRRGLSDCTSTDKESTGIQVTQPVDEPPPPPGESLAAEVAFGRRSWLRDYVDRFSLNSLSSRTLSFRSSGRFFAGSSRRSEAVVTADDDLEANRIGEEITELFRWLSGV